MEYTDFLKEWYSATDFVVVHTSGSTGKPKEIRLPKVDMLRSARATVGYFELTSRSSVASLLPMSSIATRMAVVRSIVAGCRYVEMPVANDFTVYEHIDLLSVGPSQTDCLIQHPEFAKLISAVMVGGAPLGAARREGLIKAGYRVWESYGMTETCSNVALRKIEEEMFHANEGISFSIDGRGCLIIHAPGYSFDGLQTNDVADLLSPTTFRWLGRADNAINSGGLKIHPEELEAELASMLLCEFYVVAMPDEKWGQVPLLVVERDVSSQQDKISQAVLSISDKRRRPRFYGVIPRFTRTGTGKIKRVVPESISPIFPSDF